MKATALATQVAGVLALTLATCAAGQTSIDSSVARFYEQRAFRPAWIEANGLTAQATELLDVVSHAERDGLDSRDYTPPLLELLLHRHLLPDEAWRLDSVLTHLFFIYGRDVSSGRVNPAQTDPAWTATPHTIDFVGLLETALTNGTVAATLQGLAPPESGYAALRDALHRYQGIAAQGEWPASLAQRLAAEGYDTSGGLDAAVRQFQAAHGLEPDGIVNAETRAQLNVSAGDRARQLALNLERWRWLPRELEERYVVVNSATFMLELVERDQPVLSTRAVVGRPDWPTPITSSRITDLVFRPVWYLPRTIAVKELLPILQRDPGYLAREGMRVFADSAQGGGLVDATAIDWTQINASTFTYLLAQEPGGANPLGAVKFVFWTPFRIFIHDTPQRPAFSERWRAFSHGCVRIESAAALAARLLPNWPSDSVSRAMQSGRERLVGLPQSIPVYLVYRTAWVTENGRVAFAGDPYGWDKKMAQALKPTEMFP